MLKNLIKYEFKATGRTLGLLYAALIIIACVSRLILGLNNFNDGMGGSAFPFVGIISALIVFLYAMFLCAVVVITFIVILLRSGRRMEQREVRFLSDGGQRSVYSLYDSGDGRGVYRSLGSAAVCGDVYRSDAEPL